MQQHSLLLLACDAFQSTSFLDGISLVNSLNAVLIMACCVFAV